MEDLTFSLLKAAGMGGYLLPRERDEKEEKAKKKKKRNPQALSAGEMLDTLDRLKET